MTIVRHSDARWAGDLLSGNGHLEFGSGSFSGPYSFKDRFAEASSPLTNPEELIAAAHASCFSMSFSAELSKENVKKIHVETIAKVHIAKTGEGFNITEINLETHASAEGISSENLSKIAVRASKNCPVSKALASVPISLTVNGQVQ